jgi:hypothetical protein
MFNYYVDTKDAGYFMARDRINDLLVEPVINMVDHNPILACQDRYVRMLDVNKLHYETFVQGAVMSLSRLHDTSYTDVLKQSKEKAVVFGTDSGLIGELRMDPNMIKPGWLLQNVRGLGSVTALVPHDLTKNGVDDFVVGRDDGEIQVFSLEDTGTNGVQPVLVTSKNINECVQDLKVGTVSTATFDEVVVASYSGRISSFTTEPSTDAGMQAFQAAPARVVEKVLGDTPAIAGSEQQASDASSKSVKDKDKDKDKDRDKKATRSASIKSFFGFKKKDKPEKEDKDRFVGGLVLDRPEVPAISSAPADGDEALRTDPKEGQAKLVALRAEIESLRDKVSKEKATFEKMSKESVPVSTRSKIKSSLLLDPETGIHKLTLESEMPMDLVALEGSAGLSLTLLDSGSSVPSVSPALGVVSQQGGGGGAAGKGGGVFLATLRMQGTNNRLQVQMMIAEGNYGTLNAFVVTRVAPKVVHLVENHIHPLSLHRTIPVGDKVAAQGTEPVCEIKVAGSFTLSMMHAWVRACFRDMPSKVPDEDDSGKVRCMLGT